MNPSLPIEPHDLLVEGARARKLSTDLEGVKTLVEGVRLVNDAILAQVLFALWDSGFYEYSLTHAQFTNQQAAADLNVDPTTLQWLMDYLVGRGIMQHSDTHIGLTDRGTRMSNVLLRGTMNLYIGGWGPQLGNIGPLLRREISQEHYRTLRSGRHTVVGTEQLICVRSVPPILKLLAARNLRGVLHLACRTGQFLIELARSAELTGVGVDKVGERVAQATAFAHRHHLGNRLRFVCAEAGHDRIPVDEQSLAGIDVVVALYLLHEVARDSRARVIEMLRGFKTEFPGRKFIFMETLPGDAQPVAKKPPATFSQLDYLLIHRLRAQGLPLPAAEWKAILAEAGLELIEMQEVYWSGLYLAQL